MKYEGFRFLLRTISSYFLRYYCKQIIAPLSTNKIVVAYEKDSINNRSIFFSEFVPVFV